MTVPLSYLPLELEQFDRQQRVDEYRSRRFGKQPITADPHAG